MKISFKIELTNPFGMATLDLVEDYSKEGYIITMIKVPKEHQGQGIGSLLLKECLEEADRTNTTLWLEVKNYGGLTEYELESWYKRNGFEEDTIYIRTPKKLSDNH